MDDENADIEEDVPQLEDMSEELERLKSLRTKHSVDIQTIGSKSPVNVNVSKSEQQKSNSIAKMKGQGDSKSFGGFKKGFLVSSSDSKCQEKKTSHHPQKLSAPPTKMTGTSSKDIPLIKPKPEAKSSLEFPEVQEAMKESFPFLQSQDWVTDDLLSKIHDNPVLSEAFSDPTLCQALAQFQSNSQAVMAAAKDNPKVQKFLQEFSALMGDHFTALADKEEKEQGSKAASVAPLITEAPSGEEEAQMREIISRPQVKEALSDPAIQKLIVALKEDQTTAQRLLQSGTGDFQRRVKVLIDNGLVNFQSF